MGLRFSRRVKIMPGVRLNVGLKGTSLSAGRGGASINVGKRGVHANLGIPGTGIGYRKRVAGPSSRATPSPASRPAAPAVPENVQVRLTDADEVVLLDENGCELDSETAEAVRSVYAEQLRSALESHARETNATALAALDVHVATPGPGPQKNAAPPFAIPKPLRPADPRTIDPGSPDRPAADSAWSAYMETLALWRASKAEHERRHGGPSADSDAIGAALEDALTAVDWPRETLVSLELEEGGLSVAADVDLPEIEDLPSATIAVSRRALALDRKPVAESARRRLYQRHVHAILFRIVGEIFRAAPTVTEISIAGYTQRPSAATGRVEDEYVLAVRVDRQGWSKIDFTNLAAVDPIAALARFSRQCSIDGRGHMRAIDHRS